MSGGKAFLPRRPRGRGGWRWGGWGMLLAAMPAVAAAPLTWLWASPQPHGNNVYDMTLATNGVAVQVGDRGQLYTSTDYSLWVPRVTNTTNSLEAVGILGQRVLVAGQAGTILYGDLPGPTNFTLIDLGTADWLEGVAASASLAVAVGDNGAIYTSPTGATWTRQPQGFTTWLRSVAFGTNSFVAVGEGGFIARSADGQQWQPVTSPVTADLNRVVWVGDHFVAVGTGGAVALSQDGAGRAWSVLVAGNGPTNDLYAAAGTDTGLLLVAGTDELRLLPAGATAWLDQLNPNLTAPAPTWTYYSGFWDGSLFLVGGDDGMVTSGTQTNSLLPFAWTFPAGPLRNWLWDMVHLPGLYVAVGDLATIEISDDGVAWDLDVVPDSTTNAVLLGVGGRLDLMVVVGTAGTILTSTNGVVWAAVQPAPTTNDLQGVAWFQNRLLLTGGAGTILTGTDGTHWSLVTNLGPAFLSSVAAFPGGVVATGENGALFTSADAATWTPRPTATTNWLYRVRYVGEQLFAVGQNGTLLASADGVTWTPRPTGTTAWLNDITWFNGLYYVVGTQGTVLASGDALTWTNLGTITRQSLYALATDPHQMLAAGLEGALLRGQPGPLNILSYALQPAPSTTIVTNAVTISGVPGASFSVDQSRGFPGLWAAGPVLQFLDNTGALIDVETLTNPPPAGFYRATGR